MKEREQVGRSKENEIDWRLIERLYAGLTEQ